MKYIVDINALKDYLELLPSVSMNGKMWVSLITVQTMIDKFPKEEIKEYEVNQLPHAQKIASDVLTQFMFTRNMNEVIEVWDRTFEKYDLYSDPFTGVPCTPEEYVESKLEYERQAMIEKYGHCDGLE